MTTTMNSIKHQPSGIGILTHPAMSNMDATTYTVVAKSPERAGLAEEDLADELILAIVRAFDGFGWMDEPILISSWVCSGQFVQVSGTVSRKDPADKAVKQVIDLAVSNLKNRSGFPFSSTVWVRPHVIGDDLLEFLETVFFREGVNLLANTTGGRWIESMCDFLSVFPEFEAFEETLH